MLHGEKSAALHIRQEASHTTSQVHQGGEPMNFMGQVVLHDCPMGIFSGAYPRSNDGGDGVEEDKHQAKDMLH